MSDKRDEIWYCENSKGHKIAPYGDSKLVTKPKKWILIVTGLKVLGAAIGILLFIGVLSALCK
jgi:hypothetical protein